MVKTLAGEGTAGCVDGPASTSQINEPLAVDVWKHSVYFTTTDGKLRSVDLQNRVVYTLRDIPTKSHGIVAAEYAVWVAHGGDTPNAMVKYAADSSTASGVSTILMFLTIVMDLTA